MTSTDEILALAASAAGPRSAAAGTETSAEVTEADLAAFSAAAARGAGSDVVRVLRAIRPAGPMAADPAWTAWLTAAAATSAASEATGHGEGQRAGPVHPAWLAVFAAGTDTIDGVSTATANTIATTKYKEYTCYTKGAWFTTSVLA